MRLSASSVTRENRRRRDWLIKRLSDLGPEVRDEALRRLKKMEADGLIPTPYPTLDIFGHCHTNFSYSPYTPEMLAWRAYQLGLQVTGIVDHDTVSGFKDFRKAAKILGLRNPICGYEQRVNFKNTKWENMTINSPGNPGEGYIAIHGVSGEENGQLDIVQAAKRMRIEKMAKYFYQFAKQYGIDLDYERDIAPLTEDSNPTERHFSTAIAKKIYEKCAKGTKVDYKKADLLTRKLIRAIERSLDMGTRRKIDISKKDVSDVEKLSGLLRDRVAKPLRKKYPPTDKENINIEELIGFAHSRGWIVYYLYLGGEKPCEAESKKNIEEFLDYLKSIGIDGVMFMPNRNSRTERERVLPLFYERFDRVGNGMDVNKWGMPFTWFNMSCDPRFVAEALQLVKDEVRSEQVAHRMSYLSQESLDDIKANRQGEVAEIVFVGLMCGDKFHKSSELLPGMQVDSLTLAGDFSPEAAEMKELQEQYLASLPKAVRDYLADLDNIESGGPASSSARIFAQISRPKGGGKVEITFITSVGKDAKPFMDKHEALGIDMSKAHVSKTKPSADTLVFEEPDGRRSFLHTLSASEEFSPDILKPEYFEGRKVAEFGGIALTALMPHIDSALWMAKTAGCITILDTVVDQPRQWRDFRKKYDDDYLRKILSLIDVFTPSIAEAQQIMADYLYPDDQTKADDEAKKFTPQEVVEFFNKQGAKAIFLKVGKDGAYVKATKDSIFKEEAEFHVPIFKGFRDVSPTGTGDAFVGALTYAVAQGWGVHKSAMFADVVGGMCVECVGGTINDQDLVDALYFMERLRAQIVAQEMLDYSRKGAEELVPKMSHKSVYPRFRWQVEMELANLIYMRGFSQAPGMEPKDIAREAFKRTGRLVDFMKFGQARVELDQNADSKYGSQAFIHLPNQSSAQKSFSQTRTIMVTYGEGILFPDRAELVSAYKQDGSVLYLDSDKIRDGQLLLNTDRVREHKANTRDMVYLQPGVVITIPKGAPHSFLGGLRGLSYVEVSDPTDNAGTVHTQSSEEPLQKSPKLHNTKGIPNAKILEIDSFEGRNNGHQSMEPDWLDMIHMLIKRGEFKGFAPDDEETFISKVWLVASLLEADKSKKAATILRALQKKVSIDIVEDLFKHALYPLIAKGIDSGVGEYAFLPDEAISLKNFHDSRTAVSQFLRQGQIQGELATEFTDLRSGYTSSFIGNLPNQYTPVQQAADDITLTVTHGQTILFVDDFEVVRAPNGFDPLDIPVEFSSEYEASRPNGWKAPKLKNKVYLVPGVTIRIKKSSKFANFASDDGFAAIETSAINIPEELSEGIEQLQEQGKRDAKISMRDGDHIYYVDLKTQKTRRINLNIDRTYVGEDIGIHIETYWQNPKLNYLVQRRNLPITQKLIAQGRSLPAVTPDHVALLLESEDLKAVDEQIEGGVRTAAARALTNHIAVLTTNNGVITKGLNLTEAINCNDLVEFSAKTAVVSDMLGELGHLNKAQADKLRDSYFEKYRKKMAEGGDTGYEPGEVLYIDLSQKDIRLINRTRRELLRIGQQIDDRGLVIGPGGNISACIEIGSKGRKVVLVKASGKSFATMKANEYVIVDLETGVPVMCRELLGGGGVFLMEEYAGEHLKPSTEVDFHRAIYEARPDIKAICHAHPPVSTGIASAGHTFSLNGTLFERMDYIHPGKGELPTEVGRKFGLRTIDSLLMAMHGAITVGSDLDEAFSLTVQMEEAAKKFVLKNMRSDSAYKAIRESIVGIPAADNAPIGMVDINEYIADLKRDDSAECWEMKHIYGDEWDVARWRLVVALDKFKKSYPNVSNVIVRITRHKDRFDAYDFVIVGVDEDSDVIRFNNTNEDEPMIEYFVKGALEREIYSEEPSWEDLSLAGVQSAFRLQEMVKAKKGTIDCSGLCVLVDTHAEGSPYIEYSVRNSVEEVLGLVKREAALLHDDAPGWGEKLIGDVKRRYRRRLSSQALELSQAKIRSSNTRIAKKVTGNKFFQYADSILVYTSVYHEAGTDAIIEEALKQGKKVFMPRVVNESEMEIAQISSMDDIVWGASGFPEPKRECKAVGDIDINLMIVPVTGFDDNCNRLGRGGGYFDRFFAALEGLGVAPNSIPTIGLAYEAQRLPEIPVDGDDIKLDFVVTEKSTHANARTYFEEDAAGWPYKDGPCELRYIDTSETALFANNEILFAGAKTSVGALTKDNFDTYVNVLVDAITRAADSYKDKTGDEAVIGLLSFQTNMPIVKRDQGLPSNIYAQAVDKAFYVALERRPDLKIIGYGGVQIGAAMDPRILAKKTGEEGEHGQPNVLVFPNMVSYETAAGAMSRFLGRNDTIPEELHAMDFHYDRRPASSPLLAQIWKRLRQEKSKPKIIFTEPEDKEVFDAAIAGVRQGLFDPIFIADNQTRESIRRKIEEIEAISELREGKMKNYTRHIKFVDPYDFAEEITGPDSARNLSVAKMLLAGEVRIKGMKIRADGLVAGKVADSSSVLREVFPLKRKGQGMYDFGIAQLPGKEGMIAFSNVVIKVKPTPKQVAEMAYQTAKEFERLTGTKAKVGLIATASYPDSDMIQAAKKLKKIDPDIEVLSPVTLEEALASKCNVFVPPDLMFGLSGKPKEALAKLKRKITLIVIRVCGFLDIFIILLLYLKE
ncbi:5-formyltetrahydrofolate cyclo-ligase [Candidatus Omnitrophota bacterium]